MLDRQRRRKVVDTPIFLPPLITGTGNPLINAARNKGVADPNKLNEGIKAAEKAAEARLIAETEAVHREGWDSGMKKGEKYGTAMGLSMGFNNIIKGDDYILLDKKHPDRVVTGATYNDLMAKKSVKENPRYDRLQPGFTYSADNTPKTNMDKYAGAAITLDDDRTVLHVTRFRDRVRTGGHVPHRYPELDNKKVPRLRKGELTLDEAFGRIPKPPDRPVYQTPAEKRLAKELARNPAPTLALTTPADFAGAGDYMESLFGRDFISELVGVPKPKPVKEPARKQPSRQAKDSTFDIIGDNELELVQQAINSAPTTPKKTPTRKKGGRQVLPPTPPKIVRPRSTDTRANPKEKK